MGLSSCRAATSRILFIFLPIWCCASDGLRFPLKLHTIPNPLPKSMCQCLQHSVTLSQGGPHCRTKPGHRCEDGEGSMRNCGFSGCRAPYLLCMRSTSWNEEGDPFSFLPLACQAASIVWQAVAGLHGPSIPCPLVSPR